MPVRRSGWQKVGAEGEVSELQSSPTDLTLPELWVLDSLWELPCWGSGVGGQNAGPLSSCHSQYLNMGSPGKGTSLGKEVAQSWGNPQRNWRWRRPTPPSARVLGGDSGRCISKTTRSLFFLLNKREKTWLALDNISSQQRIVIRSCFRRVNLKAMSWGQCFLKRNSNV